MKYTWLFPLLVKKVNDRSQIAHKKRETKVYEHIYHSLSSVIFAQFANSARWSENAEEDSEQYKRMAIYFYIQIADFREIHFIFVVDLWWARNFLHWLRWESFKRFHVGKKQTSVYLYAGHINRGTFIS